MKLRLAQPKHLIDIGKVPGLADQGDGGTLVNRAMTITTPRELGAPQEQGVPPALPESGVISATRWCGTWAPSAQLAHADPAADWPAARLPSARPGRRRGRRQADDQGRRFFKGLLTTALADDEILTEIRVPAAPANVKSAYAKFPHPASRFAWSAWPGAYDGRRQISKASIGHRGRAARRAAKGVEAAIGQGGDAASIQAAAEKGAMASMSSRPPGSRSTRSTCSRLLQEGTRRRPPRSDGRRFFGPRGLLPRAFVGCF